MKQCPSCAKPIPDADTLCDACSRMVADAVASVSLDEQAEAASRPAGEPSPAMTGARPATGLRLGRREMVAGASALAAVGVIGAAFMMSRGTPSQVAAAPIDRAPTAAPAAAPPPAPPPVVKWAENRANWVGHQRNAVAFEVASENNVQLWMRTSRPMLVVRCTAGTMEGFVFTDSAAKIEPQTEDHTVTFAFDQEPEVTERWPDSAEHDALFAPDGPAFVERLARAQTMKFRFTPHNASPVEARFQVHGLAELVQGAVKECVGKKK